jgi:hypothetical protein
MQDIIQFFLDLLQVTYGDLAPEKCVWYRIFHRQRMVRQDYSSCMDVTKTSNFCCGIWAQQRKSREKPRRKGIEPWYSTRWEKSVLYGEAIVGSSLWKRKIAIAYNSFYLPSLGYGMCTTTLSTKECEDIQRPVIDAILPKMSINRKAPRAVVFGIVQFDGLALDHLDTLYCHSRLQYLLGHLCCGDRTGQLMRALLRYTQLECGTMENVLE